MQLHNYEHIKEWEQLRLEAYMPTKNDVPTIGWGHTKDVKMGDVITEEQAQKFLDEDVAWAVRAVNREVTVGLTQNQFDALVSFTFNVGEGAFSKSTLLRKLNAGDYAGAAEQFPRWNKQAGKVLRGLTRRRANEMHMFLEADDNVVPSKPDEVEPLKSLTVSKEVVGGATAALTGVGAFLGNLAPQAQNIAVGGLTLALILFGGFIVWNRLNARRKG